MYVFILGHLIHKNRLYSEGEWTLKSIRKSWSSQKNKVHFVILKTGNAIKVFKKKQPLGKILWRWIMVTVAEQCECT